MPPPKSDGISNKPTMNSSWYKSTKEELTRYLSRLSASILEVYRKHPELVPKPDKSSSKAAATVFANDAELSALPLNYILFSQRRTGSSHIDKYLYGHPSGSRYRSVKEFEPHLVWLANSNGGEIVSAPPCKCLLCKDVRPSRNSDRRQTLPASLSTPLSKKAASQSRSEVKGNRKKKVDIDSSPPPLSLKDLEEYNRKRQSNSSLDVQFVNSSDTEVNKGSEGIGKRKREGENQSKQGKRKSSHDQNNSDQESDELLCKVREFVKSYVNEKDITTLTEIPAIKENMKDSFGEESVDTLQWEIESCAKTCIFEKIIKKLLLASDFRTVTKSAVRRQLETELAVHFSSNIQEIDEMISKCFKEVSKANSSPKDSSLLRVDDDVIAAIIQVPGGLELQDEEILRRLRERLDLVFSPESTTKPLLEQISRVKKSIALDEEKGIETPGELAANISAQEVVEILSFADNNSDIVMGGTSSSSVTDDICIEMEGGDTAEVVEAVEGADALNPSQPITPSRLPEGPEARDPVESAKAAKSTEPTEAAPTTQITEAAADATPTAQTLESASSAPQDRPEVEKVAIQDKEYSGQRKPDDMQVDPPEVLPSHAATRELQTKGDLRRSEEVAPGPSQPAETDTVAPRQLPKPMLEPRFRPGEIVWIETIIETKGRFPTVPYLNYTGETKNLDIKLIHNDIVFWPARIETVLEKSEVPLWGTPLLVDTTKENDVIFVGTTEFYRSEMGSRRASYIVSVFNIADCRIPFAEVSLTPFCGVEVPPSLIFSELKSLDPYLENANRDIGISLFFFALKDSFLQARNQATAKVSEDGHIHEIQLGAEVIRRKDIVVTTVTDEDTSVKRPGHSLFVIEEMSWNTDNPDNINLMAHPAALMKKDSFTHVTTLKGSLMVVKLSDIVCKYYPSCADVIAKSCPGRNVNVQRMPYVQ
ncbi:hypothetical protein HDU97_000435 [Phlyctochytrium planicorne]|nr:hypothetical protein HDU97_000435 [Phlyctochytrium planicorne]